MCCAWESKSTGKPVLAWAVPSAWPQPQHRLFFATCDIDSDDLCLNLKFKKVHFFRLLFPSSTDSGFKKEGF